MIPALFTPRTRRTADEVLDDPGCDPALRERSIADVARANRLLGGSRAVLRTLAEVLPRLEARPQPVTLLDVGTGLADIPAEARRRAVRAGVELQVLGLDGAASLLQAARGRLDGAICADALALPLATASVDVVTCSQVLHHFPEPLALQLLRELDRVARERVIVSDLRRSWLAAGGLWLVSYPMGFHPVSRADGMLSVLKGFTVAELGTLVREATGVQAEVKQRLGWRLTAAWSPSHATSHSSREQ